MHLSDRAVGDVDLPRCNMEQCSAAMQRAAMQREAMQRAAVQCAAMQRAAVQRAAMQRAVRAAHDCRRPAQAPKGVTLFPQGTVGLGTAGTPRAPRPVARSVLRCGLCPHAVHACMLPAGSSFAPQSAPRRRRASSQPLPAPERHAQAQPVDGHRGMVSAFNLQHEIQRPASLCEHVAVPAGEDDAAAAETPERVLRSRSYS